MFLKSLGDCESQSNIHCGIKCSSIICSFVYKNYEPLKGAFSVVKRCVHKKSNEAFAVKMISTTKMSKRDFEKLEREARICQKLRHENIIRLHETMNDEKK